MSTRLSEKDGFRLPMKKLREAFGPKTRAIVINNPQKPFGKVFTRDELAFTHLHCNLMQIF